MTAPLEVKNAELLPKDGVLIASRRWDSNGARLCVASEGQTLEAMIRQAVERAYPGRDERFYTLALSWCRARVDGVEMRRVHWAEVRPVAGQRVEVLVVPGGGGGKKNPLAMVLQLVVVVVATILGQVYVGPAMASAMGVTSSTGIAAISAASTAVLSMAGSMLVNALFPVSAPSLPDSSGDNSQTYALNGGQNSANPNGYVPLVLGRHRMTPPLGAKSWTAYEGDNQYFHMLVVWGHEDVHVSDFRIGETPLSEFDDVTHVFHNATKGDDLQIFGKSYNEQSVGAVLKNSEGWIERNIGEADEISFDISFPALGEANRTTGDIDDYEVGFEAQAALEGTEDWQGIGGDSFIVRGVTKIFTLFRSKLDVRVWTDHTGIVSVMNKKEKPSAGIEIYPEKDARVSGCAVTFEEFTYEEEAGGDGGSIFSRTATRVTVANGSVGTGSFSIKGSQTKPLVRSYKSAVPHGEWKVRIRRTSEDTDDNYIYDDASWSTVRAIVNRAPFSTPVPVCCSELRIRASEQLSGYVSDFNAEVVSYVGDWNGTEWEQAETNNPASLLRYCLLSRHAMYQPFSYGKLDEESLVEFHEHCAKEGFTFNFVCDTETLTWKRLTQIAAAGRGAVTCDNDGKISVVIDRAGKQPVQMFTPRNSWGFSVERAYVKHPHALRAKYRDEADDYKETNGYIYADGYDKQTATNIVEWEAEGKTNWNEVWRFGRYYLASARLRPESVTLSTDWEWRMCRRGDLVLVSHDVLTNTFGAARIAGLLYNVDGETVTVASEAAKPEGLLPVGVVLDDSVIFSEPSPARYGIAVRQNTGRVLTYEVRPQYGQESSELFFKYSLNSAQVPPLGALASVALFAADGETEIGQYLVAGITPGDNASADLTLIPYAPEIMDADTGEIPAWTAPMRLPTIPKRDNLPVPVVKEIRTDESVLLRSGASLLSCIAVWYALPSSPDSSLGEVQVQMQAKDSFGNELTATAPLTAPYIFVQGVEDGRQYKIVLRLVSSRGIASAWTEAQTVTVVGKTSAPPAVSRLTATADDPEGVRLTWAAVEVLDFDHYEVSGAGGHLKTVNPGATMPVYDKTGTLTFAVQAVDTLGLKSAKAVATLKVLPPAEPVASYTILPATGASVVWQDCKTSWSIDYYEVFDVKAGELVSVKTTVFDIPPRKAGESYPFRIRAVDIFGNYGEEGTVTVSVSEIPAPKPQAGIDGTQVRIWWPEVAAPWNIVSYEVQTGEGKAIMTVKGTEARFLAPKAGTYNYRVRAIDIAGNKSGWGEYSLALGALEAPAVSAALGEDAASVALAWTMPVADLPVVAFDLVRQWDVTRPDGITETREEDYGRFDVQAHAVPALPVGEHSFMVRAVDSSGNIGPWGSKDFKVDAPGAVTPYGCRAVYNNVMLYFTEPSSTFFKVREYLVEELEGDYPAVVGTVDAMFFAEVRSSAGTYTYGITPVDVAGNRGPRATVDVRVDNPPNLVLLHEWESTFNGTRSRLILDGHGSMLGPVPEAESWLENAERVAAGLGVAVEELTWEQKTEADMLTWLSPHTGKAQYIEERDIREVLAAPTIDVTVTQKVLEGDPQRTCRIEVSENGTAWRVAAENALNVTTERVRFVRLTFEWTGGLVQVQGIFVTMNVKSVEDSGTVMCLAADCLDASGNFLPDEEFGTRVNFNMAFIDVENDVEVKPVSGDTGLNPIVVFPEGADSYPTGFRVALLDMLGQPVDGEVFWYAKGR